MVFYEENKKKQDVFVENVQKRTEALVTAGNILMRKRKTGKMKEECNLVKEDSFEQKKKQIEQELEESGLKNIYSEVIWDIIPEINEVSRRISAECGRQVMDNVTWRIKSPESIANKLRRKNREISLDCALRTLNDMAGIRVVCPLQDDVYRMAKAIRKLPGLKVIKVKNYISHPKASGYRSIHVIVEALHNEETVRVEIQVRSVAMNYWAILDHQLCYKNERKETEKLRRELKACSIDIAEIDKRFLKLRKQIEKL